MTGLLLMMPLSSRESIAETTTRQREASEERELNVELLLPKDWQKYEPYGPQEPDAAGLVLFGRYGSRDGRAMLELHAEPIIREVSGADWFEHFARVSGYVVEETHYTTSPAGANVDAIARRPGKSGVPFVYRMATYKDAGVVYLVKGSSHPRDFVEFQESFVISIRSFRLTQPEDMPSAEPLRTVTLVKVLPLRFVIPQAWQRMHDPRADIDFVQFESLGASGQLLGRIAVLVAPTGAFATAEAVVTALGASGVRLRPGAPAALGKGFVAPQHGDLRREAGAGGQTLRVFVAQYGPSWVGVARWSMLPSAERFPIEAMNDRAFDIVLRTLNTA